MRLTFPLIAGPMIAGLIIAGLAIGCSSGGRLPFAGDGGDNDASTSGTDSKVPGTTDTRIPGIDTEITEPEDTRVADTSTPKPDTGPVTCATPLPSGYTCTAPDAKAGSTVCTDAAITALVNGCFGSTGSESACTSARTTYASCSTCVLTTWLYEFRVDSGACIRKIDSTSTCGKTWRCSVDCLTEVCSSCDETSGSGSDGVSSEMDECMVKHEASGGRCYDLATKNLATCSMDSRFARCFPKTTTEVIYFYRGACRDNGNWSSVTTP